MKVYTLDPLKDKRWTEFIDRHDSSSVFHTTGWLDAIRLTYGYEPVVYTTSEPSQTLANGVVLCRIKSWLTGRRMVSLPFSDHCEPLLDGPEAAAAIADELNKTIDRENLKYIEIRPKDTSASLEGAVTMPPSFLHILDLKPDVNELLHQTHRSCIQRPIRRAENEGLEYECGNSDRLLDAFYRLMVQTRRRHQLPPQPIQWFKNLIACMGDPLKIRVASKDGRAIASMLTLQHKRTIVYKYGCSDSRFHNLGGMPLLFWKTIVEAKSARLTSMDFGRSDADNPGLISFKERWGTKSSQLVYLRWSRKQTQNIATGHSSGVIKRLFAMMPNSVLETTGRILYKHIG